MKSPSSNLSCATSRAQLLFLLALFAVTLFPVACGGGGGGGGGGFVGPGVIVSTTGPTLTEPASPTQATTTTISGTALRDGSEIRVEGGALPVQMPANTDRSFAIPVQLRLNSINRLYVTERFSDGTESPVIALEVVQDQSAPSVFIDFPPEGALLTSSTTDVAGRVTDFLNGSQGLTVMVNGLPASVDSGLGTHSSFFVQDVPLNAGTLTLIEAVVTDLVGNSSSRAVTVELVDIAPEESVLIESAGNNQVGPVSTMLPTPLAVQVFRGDGSPFAGKVVTFQVDRSSGRLGNGSSAGSPRYRAITDGSGIAQAFWTLGQDAGPGNNRVSVRSTDIVGTVYFCANATPGPPTQINVGSGGRQVVQSNGPLGEKLTAWVSDSKNGVAGVPVTFRVVRGGGLVDGLPSTTVVTGPTGHASVRMVAGSLAGTNIVSATYPGFDVPAFFLSETLRLNSVKPTTLEGAVFNDSYVPIDGALCTLVVDGVAIGTEVTDASGQFLFADAMASGLATLTVDGSAATTLGGEVVPAGSFPALEYEFFLIPNSSNRLPAPISLPRLDPANERSYDGTSDVTLRVDGIEGFSVTVEAGSVTLADGSQPSVMQPITLSLNAIQPDNLPGPVPDGGAPNFAWIFEPPGLQLDPPALITYPNLAGLPAGTITQFFEFNPGVNRFDSFGTGQVSEGGSNVVHDVGVGLAKSGIGLCLPPYANTAECKNCNILVSGPETATTNQPLTYTASAIGPGTVTWKVFDGFTAGLTTQTLGMDATGATIHTLTFSFLDAGPAGTPTTPGIRVEATLECPDGITDRHAIGVEVTPN